MLLGDCLVQSEILHGCAETGCHYSSIHACPDTRRNVSVEVDPLCIVATISNFYKKYDFSMPGVVVPWVCWWFGALPGTNSMCVTYASCQIWQSMSQIILTMTLRQIAEHIENKYSRHYLRIKDHPAVVCLDSIRGVCWHSVSASWSQTDNMYSPTVTGRWLTHILQKMMRLLKSMDIATSSDEWFMIISLL